MEGQASVGCNNTEIKHLGMNDNENKWIKNESIYDMTVMLKKNTDVEKC